MNVPTPWLVRLRWAIGAGQLGLIGAIAAGWAPGWPLAPIFGVFAAGVASNIALSLGRSAPEWVVAAVLLLDTTFLTILLAVTGGTSSPMSALYLVPVMASAFTVRSRLVALGVLATATAYGALFAFGPPPPHHHDHTEMQLHVLGMFVAYLFVAPLLAVTVLRVRRAGAEAAEALAQARALEARTEHLASLATLAAGASHELATPLSTILLVASELERKVPDADEREDLQLIRDEVLRCQDVLQQMSADAGAATAELAEPVTVQALVDEILAHAARFEPVTVVLRVPESTTVTTARRQIAQVARRLLGNARDATGPGESITLTVDAPEGGLELSVIDEGSGMDAETLRRATEPFFSTKPEGSGSGLGLFFARSVVEHLDGQLELESAPGRGTRATIHLPGAAP